MQGLKLRVDVAFACSYKYELDGMCGLDSINIRRPKGEDVQSLLSVEQTCFTDHRFEKAQFEYYLRNPNSIFWVAESDGALIGYVCGIVDHRGKARTARLYSMAVLPEKRKQGVGAMLLRRFERQARRVKCESVTLEVYEKNVTAIALYRSFGYGFERPLPDYYGPGQNGLEMRKYLRREGG